MFLGPIKDAALQLVAAWAVNKYHLKKLGHMKLKIDSEKNQVFITLDLKGEQTPVELTVDYQLLSPTQIEIVTVHSSREWIATLVNDMVSANQKLITVPEYVTKALKLFH